MRFNRLRGVLSWKLIGPATVIAAVLWAGPRQVWVVLSGAHLGFVAAAVALAVPLALLKGARWKTLLDGQNVPVSFREGTGMYAMGMTMAAVTPGHLGDFAKILPLLDRGCGLGRAVACNVIDRVLDVAFVVLAGYGGMWYFSAYFASQLWVANIAILVGLVAALVVVTRRHLVTAMALKLVPEKYRPSVREAWNELIVGSARNSLRRGLSLGFWTLAFWPIQFLAAYFCGLALGLEIPFLYLCACVAVATVVSFVPVTVAGIGARDATFIVLLGPIGVARHESIALASLVLAVFVANCVVFYLISVVFRAAPAAPQMAARTRSSITDSDPRP